MRSQIASAIDSGAGQRGSQGTAAPTERLVRRLMTSMASRKEQEAAAPLPQKGTAAAAEPVAAQRPARIVQQGDSGT